jgi:hypothetical protein
VRLLYDMCCWGKRLGLSTVHRIDGFTVAVYGSRHRTQGIEQIWAVYGNGAIRAVFYRILRPYTAVNTVTTISYIYIDDSI